MGSPAEEIEAFVKLVPDNVGWQEIIKSQGPSHKVILTEPYYLGTYEITQAQYETLMAKNPSEFTQMRLEKDGITGVKASELPVESLTWQEAAEFCAKLSQRENRQPFSSQPSDSITLRTGTGYRLPSEAEWEFACRSGTTTRYYSGNTDTDLARVGWNWVTSQTRPHEVGELTANSFGLFDMHGNVSEWGQDGYEATFYATFHEKPAINPLCPLSANGRRVTRSGNFYSVAECCRSGDRNAFDERFARGNTFGFRVLLEVDAVKQALKERTNSVWNSWPDDAPVPAIAPFNAEQAQQHQEAWAKYLNVPVEYTNSIGMKFRLIPPGEFTMGSTPAEIDAALKEVGDDKVWREALESEAPQHKVILTQPIYFGVNEVTQADYIKVISTNPSHFALLGAGKEVIAGLDTADHPVEMVSWNDAAEFCAQLSQQEKMKLNDVREGDTIASLDGTNYRLPSEAEWEFACRAGTATKFWLGNLNEDLVRAGWFGGNSGNHTHAVRGLGANPYGLYDMHGNVWEFVQDGWDLTYYAQFQTKPAVNSWRKVPDGSNRVIRGGSWSVSAPFCRVSTRLENVPTFRSEDSGFRVSLPVDAVRQALKVTVPEMTNGTKTTASKFPPLAPGWFERVSKLPPEEQVKEVSLELKRRNPEWDEKLEFNWFGESEHIISLRFSSSQIVDITPVSVLTRLKILDCKTSNGLGRITDLSPLAGLKDLGVVILTQCRDFVDLSPLREKPLAYLDVSATSVTDLSPVVGREITLLNVEDCEKLTDLSAVKGAPLTGGLSIVGSGIKDLTPLRGSKVGRLRLADSQFDPDIVCGWPLKSVDFATTTQKVPREKLLRLKEIKTLETIDGKPVAEFWKEFDKLGASKFPPLAPGWFERVSKLPPEEQVKEVSLELKRRNPEWDEKLEHTYGIKEPPGMKFDSSHVADITPLSVLTRLQWLHCRASNQAGPLTDLSPLTGLKSLGAVTFIGCPQLTDLTPLKSLPITYVDLRLTPITDLSPLAGKSIQLLNLFECETIVDLAPLKDAPLNQLLSIARSGIRDLSPLQDSKVESVDLMDSQFDPNIVCHWPLKSISFDRSIQKVPREKLVRLKEIKTLKTIDGKPVAEFWKEFDAAAPMAATLIELFTSPDSQWSAPVNLGSAINTSAREANPSLTSDELLLVFTRGEELFETRRASRDEPFAPATKLAGPLPSAKFLTCCLSGDGLQLVFSAYPPGGSAQEVMIATRASRDEPFGQPVVLPQPINSAGEDRHPVLSPDGLILALTSARGGQQNGGPLIFTRPTPTAEFNPPPTVDSSLQGGWSVIDSFSSDGRGLLKTTMADDVETITWHTRTADSPDWSEGQPLPTPFDSIQFGAPFLSTDGNTIYFHSRSLPDGQGDLDLWMSRRTLKTP